jgi:hypothetical protein
MGGFTFVHLNSVSQFRCTSTLPLHFRAPKRVRGEEKRFKSLVKVLPDWVFLEEFSVVVRTFVHLVWWNPVLESRRTFVHLGDFKCPTASEMVVDFLVRQDGSYFL